MRLEKARFVRVEKSTTSTLTRDQLRANAKSSSLQQCSLGKLKRTTPSRDEVGQQFVGLEATQAHWCWLTKHSLGSHDNLLSVRTWTSSRHNFAGQCSSRTIASLDDRLSLQLARLLFPLSLSEHFPRFPLAANLSL